MQPQLDGNRERFNSAIRNHIRGRSRVTREAACRGHRESFAAGGRVLGRIGNWARFFSSFLDPVPAARHQWAEFLPCGQLICMAIRKGQFHLHSHRPAIANCQLTSANWPFRFTFFPPSQRFALNSPPFASRSILRRDCRVVATSLASQPPGSTTQRRT